NTRQIFFGIIKVGVDLRETRRKLALQQFSLFGERLLVERKTRAHLRLTVCRDHLPQPLRCRERKFSVQKGALGKLPAFGKSRAQLQRSAKDAACDLRAAVTVQLHDVLPRKGMRRLKIDTHSVIGET